MLLVTSNKSKRLLNIRYLGQVRLDEFQSALEDLKTELGAVSPNFRCLVDLSQLESLGLDCVPEIGRVMEFMGQASPSLVVRFIPDTRKDFGLNILTIFHYPKHLRVVTCHNLNDVAKILGL